MAQRSFFDRVVLYDAESAVSAAAAVEPAYPPAGVLYRKEGDSSVQVGMNGTSMPVSALTSGASASVNRSRNPTDERSDNTRYTLDATDILRGTYYSFAAPPPSRTARGWARDLSQETIEMIDAAQSCDSYRLKNALSSGLASRSIRNRDANDETILHTVLRHNSDNLSCLLSILSETELPNLLPNAMGESPLHVAAQQAHHMMLLPMLLRSYRKGYSRPDARGDSYLHTLVKNSQLTTPEVFRILTVVLKEHPDVVPQQTLNIRNLDGHTVLDLTAIHHRTDVAAADMQSLLMRFGAATGVTMVAGELVRVRAVEDDHRRKVHLREAGCFTKFMGTADQERMDILLKARILKVSAKLLSKEMVARALLADSWLRGHNFLYTARSLEHAELVRMQYRIHQDNQALRVQCWWRQHQAVQRAEILRVRRAELTGAALVLQRLYRKFRMFYLLRATRCAQRLHATRTCQAMWRLRQLEKRIYVRELEGKKKLGSWVDDSHRSLVASAVRCQSSVRGYLARCVANRRMTAIVSTQSHLSYLMAIKEVNRRRLRCISTDVVITVLRLRRARELRVQLCIKERALRACALITTSAWRDHLVNTLYIRVRRRAAKSQHPIEKLLVKEGVVEGTDASLLWTLRGTLPSTPYIPMEEEYPPNTRYLPISQNYRDVAAIEDNLTTMEVYDDAEKSFIRGSTNVKRWSKSIGDIYTEYVGWASFTPFENLFEKHKGALQLLDALGYVISALMLVSMIFYPRTKADNIFKVIDFFAVALLWLRLIIMPKTVGLLFDCLTVLASTISLIASFDDGNIFYTFLLLKLPLFVAAHHPVRFYAVCTYSAAFVSTLYGWFLLTPACLSVIGIVLRMSIVPGDVQAEGGIAQRMVQMLSTNSAGGVSSGSSAFSLPALTIGSWTFVWWSYASCAFGVLFALKKVLEEEVWVYEGDQKDTLPSRADHQFTQKDGDDRVFGDNVSMNHNARWLREIVSGKVAIQRSKQSGQVPPNLPQLLETRAYWEANKPGVPTETHEQLRAAAVTLWFAADTSSHIDRSVEATHSCVLKDTDVIESVFQGDAHRGPTSLLHTTMLRQWVGAVHKREAHTFINVCLILCGLYPNQWPMEMCISSIFIVELLLSIIALPWSIVSRHWWFPFLIRVWCCVCGFLPWTLPFVALRGLRLLEGWGALLIFSRTHKYMVATGVVHIVLFWMVGYASLLQGSYEVMSDDGWCTSRAHCLQRWTMIFILPTIDSHVANPITNSPTAAVILFFRFVYVPLFVMITLHPLLRLTVFAVRLLRQITRSIHDDLLLHTSAFLEGGQWYRARAYTLSELLHNHAIYGLASLHRRVRLACRRRGGTRKSHWIPTSIHLGFRVETSSPDQSPSVSRTASLTPRARDLSPSLAPSPSPSHNVSELIENMDEITFYTSEHMSYERPTYEARRAKRDLQAVLGDNAVVGTFVALRVAPGILRKMLALLHRARYRINTRRKWNAAPTWYDAHLLHQGTREVPGGAPQVMPRAFGRTTAQGALSHSSYPVPERYVRSLLGPTSSFEEGAPLATLEDSWSRVDSQQVSQIGRSTFGRTLIDNRFSDVLLSAVWYLLSAKITMNVFHTPDADADERDRVATTVVVETSRKHRVASQRHENQLAPSTGRSLMSPRSLGVPDASEVEHRRDAEVGDRLATRNKAIKTYLTLTRIIKARHNKPLHYVNFALLLIAIGFIWAESTVSPSPYPGSILSIFSVVIVVFSTCISIVVLPLDASGTFTVFSAVACVTAIVFHYTPTLQESPNGHFLYSLRFVIHLRLLQVLVGPLAFFQYFASILTRAALRYMWFIVFFCVIVYVAELLRAQITVLFMPFTFDYAESESSGGTLAYRDSTAVWGSDAGRWYPDGEMVREMLWRNMSANIDTYYLFYQYWLIPTVSLACIAAYLRFFSLNMRTTPSLIAESIRRLPDPLSCSRMPRFFNILFPAGCILLIGSLIFVSISEPSAVNNVDNLEFVNQTARNIVSLNSFEELDNTYYTVECAVIPFLLVDSFARLWFEGLMLQSRCYAVRDSNRRRLRRVVSFLYQLICMGLLAVSFIVSLICLLSPAQSQSLSRPYVVYLVPMRFLLLARHQHFSLWDLLLEHAGWVGFVVVCSSSFVCLGGGSLAVSSRLRQDVAPLAIPADLQAFYSNRTLDFGELFEVSTKSVLRCILTTSLPSIGNETVSWLPYCDADFASPTVFAVAMFGRLLFACFVGFFTALISVHLEPLLSTMPPYTQRLYGFLSRGSEEYHAGLLNSRGTDGIVLMRPGDSPRVISSQITKFCKGVFQHYQYKNIWSAARTPTMWTIEERYNTNGCIPSYMLPHLLEELQIVNPCLQRATMWLLKYLIQVVPLLHERRRRVRTSLQWHATCRAGGPVRDADSGWLPGLLFSFVDHSITLGQEVTPIDTPPNAVGPQPQVFVPRLNLTGVSQGAPPPPRPMQTQNRHGLTYTYPDYVSSLHLVEALSILELGFPSSTSGDCVLYEDLVSYQFKERAATLFQAAWKQYQTIRHMERVCPYRVVVAFRLYRRTARQWMSKKKIEAKAAGSFEAALQRFKHVYNPRGRHYELVASLHRSYSVPAVPRDEAYSDAESSASSTSTAFRPARQTRNVLIAGSRPLDVGLLTHDEQRKWKAYLHALSQIEL